MTTQHPSASRTRLPILIAAWLFIVAAIVTMSSGLPGVVQAQAERGAIPSLTLHSNAPGQLHHLGNPRPGAHGLPAHMGAHQ